MESESGGGHFPRVFRLLKGPSIAESNQRGKRNKNHMNPLIQLKKVTPLFVIALMLACFALSPQAFAQCSLIPSGSCNLGRGTLVKVCCTTPGVTRIHVIMGGAEGDAERIACPTGCAGSYCGKVCVPHGVKLTAQCYVGATKVCTVAGTFMKNYSSVFWVIGGIVLAAALIWLFRKRLSASR